MKIESHRTGKWILFFPLIGSFSSKSRLSWTDLWSRKHSKFHSQMQRTTYLVLDLWDGAKKQVFLVLASLLSDPKHYDVSARLQCLALGLCDQLVFAYALCEFRGAQHWVWLLVDVLVCALVNTVFAVVDQILRGVSLWQVLPEPAVRVVSAPSSRLTCLFVWLYHHVLLVREEIYPQVLPMLVIIAWIVHLIDLLLLHLLLNCTTFWFFHILETYLHGCQAKALNLWFVG